MEQQMGHDTLILLVQRLLSGEGTEDEQTEWLTLLQRNVPAPDVSRYIFYYDKEHMNPEDKDLSAEAIVDRALAYKPVQL